MASRVFRVQGLGFRVQGILIQYWGSRVLPARA